MIGPLASFAYYFLAAALLTVRTYHIRNSFWRWAAIIVPPLFLLPLAVLPARGPQSFIFAVPLIIAMLVSVIMLVIRGIQWIRGRPVPHLKARFVRPMLTILVCKFVFAYQEHSWNLAQNEAIALAHEVQRQSVEAGRCPETICGWTNATRLFWSPPDEVHYKERIWTLGIPYTILYRATTDRTSFELTLSRGFNMYLTIQGGVTSELRATYCDEIKYRDVPVHPRPRRFFFPTEGRTQP